VRKSQSAASLIDHQDGRHSIRITSTSPGVALVAVTLEGTPLISQPIVDLAGP